MSIYQGMVLTVVGIGIIVIIVSILYSLYEQRQLERHTEKKERNEEEQIEYDDVRQKIIELNEYGEYLKQELDKKHKELLFLYQMILEKQKEINVNHLEKQMGMNAQIEKEALEQKDVKASLTEQTDHESINFNQTILKLSREGKTSMEIAKQLNIGKGQVDLVLNLYH